MQTVTTDARAPLRVNGVEILPQAIDEATLKARLAQAAEAQPQPELHLFADKNVRYESVAKVLSDAQTAGVTKLGFVTEPATK